MMKKQHAPGFIVGVNYSNNAYNAAIPAGSTIITGTNPLQPGKAIVWK